MLWTMIVFKDGEKQETPAKMAVYMLEYNKPAK